MTLRVLRMTAAGVAVTFLAGCSSLQQDADDQAARLADHVLPSALDDALAAADPPAQTPDQRAIAAEDWLSTPDPSVTDSHGGAVWVLRGSQGTTIRVDVYRYWESGDFFPPDQGEAAWGVACRRYDVADPVTSSPMECPDGTPEEP